MVNEKLLNDKIDASGKKKSYLAKRCNLSRQGFYNCIKGKAMLNSMQISTLCEELNVKSLREKEAIFFAVNGAYNAPRT